MSSFSVPAGGIFTSAAAALPPPAPTANSTGVTSQVINLGEISNKGVDATLTFKDVVKSKDFSWTSAFNFSRNVSHVIKVGDNGNDKVILAGGSNATAEIDAQKGQAYECGIPSAGTPWNQFNVGYYLYALIFLIFDVELVFMYPWAVAVRKAGMVALGEIVVFLFILFMGFLYAHKKGALKWM